jgi:hypothetical protein
VIFPLNWQNQSGTVILINANFDKHPALAEQYAFQVFPHHLIEIDHIKKGFPSQHDGKSDSKLAQLIIL